MTARSGKEELRSRPSRTIPPHCQVFRAFPLNLPQIAHVKSPGFPIKEWQMKRVLRPQSIGLPAAVLFGGAFGLISPAGAQTFSSSYTSTAPKHCRMVGKPGDLDGNTTRACPGKSGLMR